MIKEIENTPWGAPDHAEYVTDGIYFVETPSHGGYYVAPELQDQIPADIVPFTKDRSWYEEDCDWAIVALAFPDEFASYANMTVHEITKYARGTIKHFHPEWLPLFAK